MEYAPRLFARLRFNIARGFSVHGNRTLLLAIALQLSMALCVFAQRPPRQTRRVLTADQYPGADIGAKINAADKDLGSNPGEIVVNNGGTIRTQIIISSGHTLRLMPGTYAAQTAAVPILLKPGSSVVGAGWNNTIILESTAPGQFTVISAYNHSIRNGTADSNLLIRDVQIKGANSGFNSAPQAVSLGNCANCTVERVWINGTRSIGIQLGGSSSLGYFADNSKVVNCLFTRVASQNLALVNGRNILFEGNKFLAPGQWGGPGSTNIDLEVNEGKDRLENVTIRNNLIDVRDSEIPTSGNGIVVQASSGTPYVGPVLVENNTIIGGRNQAPIVTNVLSNGIFVFGQTMRDVTIRNNTITRTGQAGIRISGTNLTVINNRLTDIGGGGTPGFIVEGVTNSRIIGNTVAYTGLGPFDGRMVIGSGSKGNVYQDNRGFVMDGNAR
ncbi:MAG TPA: right-handed parallel beta-helix repeat-containing protein [Pyrinomonadaceae bacterium]